MATINIHVRDHEELEVKRYEWRYGRKSVRSYLKDQYIDSLYVHLSSFHHAILPKNMDVSGVENIHYGYHDEDDDDT